MSIYQVTIRYKGVAFPVTIKAPSASSAVVFAASLEDDYQAVSVQRIAP